MTIWTLFLPGDMTGEREKSRPPFEWREEARWEQLLGISSDPELVQALLGLSDRNLPQTSLDGKGICRKYWASLWSLTLG